MKPGPKLGHGATIRTRYATAIRKAVIRAAGPVRIDHRRWARGLGAAPDTLRKAAMVMRRKAWCFQAKHFLLYLVPGSGGRRMRPVLYAISRHKIHLINHGRFRPRGVRWHWRYHLPQDWQSYLVRLKKLALSMIYREQQPCDGTLKGFSPATSRARAGGARAPNENRAAWRRYGGLAARLNDAFASSWASRGTVDIKGWLINRLREQHEASRIVEKLIHAVTCLNRRERVAVIPSPIGYTLAIAAIHLDSDGLVPSLRKKAWRSAPAFNEVNRKPAAIAKVSEDKLVQDEKIFIDLERRKWKHGGGTYWIPV